MDKVAPKTIVVRGVADIATAVREQRAGMRATRAEVAEAAGLSRHFIADVEHGKPSVTIDKLIVLLGVMRIRLDVRMQAPRLLEAARRDDPRASAPPAMPMRSMHDDPATVGCLECGMRVKDMRRHLAGAHAMRLTEYRQRWGIPQHVDLRSRVAAERDRSRLATRVAMTEDGA